MPTWTQLEAFNTILPTLPPKRLAVLKALTSHHGCTGMELSYYMNQDARNVTPRLNELRKMYNAIHKGEPRACTRTGQMAETWWCGPADGLTLKQRQAESASANLAARLKELLTLHPLEIAQAAFILGTTEAKVAKAEKYLKESFVASAAAGR